MADDVIGLFPTPFLRVPGALDAAVVEGLLAHFTALAVQDNSSSDKLSHTRMLQPSDSPLLVMAAAQITPKLIDFGALLFGERLGWSIKEMWVNVLETGADRPCTTTPTASSPAWSTCRRCRAERRRCS
jgi:hypothetical protein